MIVTDPQKLSTIGYENVERTAKNNLWDSLRLLIGFFDPHFARPPRFSSCLTSSILQLSRNFYSRCVQKKISADNATFFFFFSLTNCILRCFNQNTFLWITYGSLCESQEKLSINFWAFYCKAKSNRERSTTRNFTNFFSTFNSIVWLEF